MKKVALLAPLPPPYGGIAVWTQRILKARKPDDWDVSVVDEKVIGNRTVFGKNSGRSFFSELKRCLVIWKKLINIVCCRETKIVHICIPAGIGSIAREIVSTLIARIFRKKVIVHFRCTLPYMVSKGFHLILFKTLLFFSNGLLVLNEKSAKYLRELNYRKYYEVIPNFIKESELNMNRTCAEKINTILYVGGVIPEKGCDKIVDVAARFPEIQFRLVGKIGIDNQNIPNNVLFLGEQNQQIVHQELLNADAFVFLSKFQGEGFSNALAEAMASGLPCIVSDWAANADMIEDGKGGIVLQENCTDAIERAINELSDQNRRQRFSCHNCQKAFSEYQEKKIIDSYFSFYENLIRT